MLLSKVGLTGFRSSDGDRNLKLIFFQSVITIIIIIKEINVKLDKHWYKGKVPRWGPSALQP
jgi:hypothetical protein